ncbi:Uracil phosphoribosyltransferase, synthesizes UMP from uracil, partial [Ascosphaera aggregata]
MADLFHSKQAGSCSSGPTENDQGNMDLLYKPDGKKPDATVSQPVDVENVHILPQTPQLIALLTMIRDKNTGRADFIFYSNRIIRLLVEEGLNHLPVVERVINTPTGRAYTGVQFEGKICGVSIMRAGEAMEQ